jgi:peptidoglycan/xylan/chitin deacetylase (PgdA/CDA1 family)
MDIRLKKFTIPHLSIVSMMTITCMISANVSAYIAPNDNNPNDDSFNWPGGAKAAVSLSYDDALNSQLDNAIPALNKYGFKGSFYLTLASKVVKQRREDWRTIAEQGHELGNHTINHACSGSLPNRQWVDKHNDLDNKTMAQIKREIIDANNLLNAIDGQTIRTFTLPCGDAIVDGKNLLPEIAGYFIGIKSHVDVIPTSMSRFNTMNAPVVAPVGVSGQALIDQVILAAQNNSIASFTFHGIGAEHLAVSTEAHQQLLDYLAKNKASYWVDTYRNISRYVNKNNDTSLK